MVIRPISNVNYNRQNYNNLNFEARKKNDNQYHEAPRRSSGLLKSIPLAAIIAMSPLNSAQAQNTYQPQEKIVLQQNYDDGKEKFKIYFISTDGNDDNAEKLKISYEEDIHGHTYSNGEMAECQSKKYHTVTLKGFETVHTNILYQNEII